MKGAITGGGLWKALEVLDDAVLQSSVSTLNDVTLTSPNIGANEWTDAQHTHASPATAGSTLGPGTTLSSPAFAGVISTGAQFAGNLGVGVAPAAWQSVRNALQIGQGTALWGDTGSPAAHLSANTYYAASGYTALTNAAATVVEMLNGAFTVQTAPSVAAGAAQTFTTRAQIAQTGTLTLTPDAGQAAVSVSWGSAGLAVEPGNATNARLRGTNGSVEMAASNGYWHPNADNALNLGVGGARFIAVYAVNGTIQTSSVEAKQDITPLDPGAALQAVRATTPVTFDYKTPTRGPEWYELPPDPEQAYARLLQRMKAAPLEQGARHQAGFVLDDPSDTYHTDPLFQTGEGQSNAANTAGILLAAIQALDARLSALEGT